MNLLTWLYSSFADAEEKAAQGSMKRRKDRLSNDADSVLSEHQDNVVDGIRKPY